MNISDFDYDLPVEFIAQTPLEPRDSSRLLVLDRKSGAIEHTFFRNLDQFIRPPDMLVLNETRVIPARIYATKIPTGGRVEILLLRRIEPLIWESIVGGKGLYEGRSLQIKEGLQAEIYQVLDGPRRLVRFDKPVEPYLSEIGHVPLPPYIHTELSNPERYQTVYAHSVGSAAAPTAGLHFTPDLLDHIQQVGIGVGKVTLHVGLDTFAPVTEENPRNHIIHSEWCRIDLDTVQKVQQTRSLGGRIVAVGTTSVRTLESAARGANEKQIVLPFEGPTDLYILPGFQFRVVDALITNFHLPRSTLLMLVSAFAGRENILAAYEEAKSEGYRFYSFGDAMLLL